MQVICSHWQRALTCNTFFAGHPSRIGKLDSCQERQVFWEHDRYSENAAVENDETDIVFLVVDQFSTGHSYLCGTEECYIGVTWKNP